MLSRSDEGWGWQVALLALFAVLSAVVVAGVVRERFVHDASVVRAGDASVLVDERHDAEGGVGGGGTLAILAGGCVAMTDVSGGPGMVVIWANGTEVSGTDEDLVVESRGQQFTVGRVFTAGQSGPTSITQDEVFGDLVPDTCRDLDAMRIYPEG